MKPLVFLLVAAALSTAYSIRRYMRDEHAHRSRWKSPPAEISDDPPYRRAPGSPAAASAPALVRLTAFACLWLGPPATLLVLIRSMIFRPGVQRMVSAEPLSLLDGGMLVQDLGTLLLARDARASSATEMVAPVLRMLALTLIAFAGLFLLAGKGPPAFWATVLGIGVCFAVLVALLRITSRRWVAPAREPERHEND